MRAFSVIFSVPTCSVTSRIHFDQELACRHSKYGPLSVAAGAVSRLPPVANGSGQYHFFVGPAAGTCMHDRKNTKERKKEEPITRLKQREKLRSKGKSCTKTNSCNPKVTVTDKSSKEGLRRPVSSTGGSQSFSVFEPLKGESGVGDGTNHSVKVTCISFRNRAGVPDRFIVATSGNKSFESTKIDSGQTPSTTEDGCLAGRRPLRGGQKKKKKKKTLPCHRLAM